MKNILLIYFLIFIFLTNCGFKVVNQSEQINFDIAEIVSSGDKRINYVVKGKLLSFSKKDEEKLINIRLNSNKDKIVKEKNIKNEITKYQIDITIKLEFEEVGKNETYRLDLSKSGDFDVSNRYSQTLVNEKKLTKLLTNDITDDLLNLLINKLNEL